MLCARRWGGGIRSAVVNVHPLPLPPPMCNCMAMQRRWMHPVGKYNELEPSSRGRWLMVSPCPLQRSPTLFLSPPHLLTLFLTPSCSTPSLPLFPAHHLFSLVLVSRSDSIYNFKFRTNPTRSTEIYFICDGYGNRKRFDGNS